MSNYLLVKYIHVFSAVIVMGTGLGIAFFMLMAYYSKNLEALKIVTKYVVMADIIFTTPAVLVQLFSGMYLMKVLHYSYSSAWFLAVIVLFVFIGMCWIPVLIIQAKLRKISAESDTIQQCIDRSHLLMFYWTALGVLAFSAIVVILYLMVVKPLPIT